MGIPFIWPNIIEKKGKEMAQVIDCEVKFNLPRVELEIKNAERNLKIKEDEIIKLKADIGKLRLQLALYGDQGGKQIIRLVS